jgi:hypothetical protein
MPDRDRAPTTLAIRSLFINDSLSKFRLNVQSERLQRQFGDEMTGCIGPFCESTRADLGYPAHAARYFRLFIDWNFRFSGPV